MDNKLVSIIMPTYNSNEYVSEAIESVQQQTYSNWELLVVDDYSEDDTCEIVEKFVKNDKRIVLFKLLENGGSAVARNVALKVAKGRYIAFLDSDDIWFEEKLVYQLALFTETKAPLVYSMYEKVDQYGNKEGRIVTVPESIDYAELLKATVIATVTAMYDTHRVGLVYFPLMRKRQDYGLWLSILRQGGRARAVMKPLAYLRKRPGSVSSNKITGAPYVWHVYRKLEKLSVLSSIYHFSHYAFRAVLKSKL